jgi:hypothetical protein
LGICHFELTVIPAETPSIFEVRYRKGSVTKKRVAPRDYEK